MKSFSCYCRVSGLMVVLLTVALAGCGDKGKDKKASQSLVRVNSDEITVHQVNGELARMNIPKEQQQQATQQVVQALIDRQLLERAALDEKLDRNPNVLQAIERAKSQVLAQAYMEKLVAGVAKPTKSEVDSYYSQHPEFFSQRKAFALQELNFSTADYSEETKAKIDAAKTMEEVVNWLKEKNIRFGGSQVVRTSTDLPPPVSKQLASMQPGQLIAIKGADRVMVAALLQMRDAPIPEANAKPQIEQFLFNQKRKEVADSAMKKMRESAKIEYLDKNLEAAKPAGGEKAAQPEQGKPAESAAIPALPPVEAPAAPAGDAAESSDASHIERGVAGLK